MRQLRYSVAMSLDGYIAGPQGEADWIAMDPEIDFAALCGRFDTLLMGRKTYAAMAGYGGVGGGPFAGMEVIVASRTLDPAEHPAVRVVGGELEGVVRGLKVEPGKDLWLFGGGELFAGLLALRLVDAVEVAIIPVLLGGGIALLPPPSGRAGLELRSHRVYGRTGTVWLEYAVAPPQRRRRRR